MTIFPASLEGLPDSPYAAELRKARPSARFAPALEADYVRSHLRDSRPLVRVSCTLGVLLIGLRVLEAVTGTASVMPRVDLTFFVVLTTSVTLVWLAWSRSYEQRYLPWAHALIPLRNALAAMQVVRVVAHGELDVLLLVPLLLIGPFYFLGLRYRAALVVVVITGASMLGAALSFHLPLPEVLHSAAFSVTSIIAFAIAAQHLEKHSRRAFLESRLVAELAQHDVLTWTKNRRVFDEYLPRLWRQAADDRRALAILLIDVDHFKSYNDRYGHQAGDAALRKVAHAIQACVRRPLDLVARYGGEEFTAILYDTDGSRASGTAERIRRAVEELALEHRGSRATTALTVSIGVAVVEPSLRRNPSGALQLADEALYRAKSGGRNRLELLDDEEYRLLVTGVFPQELSETLKRSVVTR